MEKEEGKRMVRAGQETEEEEDEEDPSLSFSRGRKRESNWVRARAIQSRSRRRGEKENIPALLSYEYSTITVHIRQKGRHIARRLRGRRPFAVPLAWPVCHTAVSEGALLILEEEEAYPYFSRGVCVLVLVVW